MSEPAPHPCALPLSSLRLLVSPLRLMSAALWGIVQHRAVEHYGLLEHFIAAVHDNIPGLLTYSERIHIFIGLRAKMLLEMCNTDDLCSRQNLQSQLKTMENLIRELADEESQWKMKASLDHFSKVIYSLLDDPHEKDIFYQKTSQFDQAFDTSMQTLVRKLLMHLENLLPVPSLDQTSLWLGLSPSVLKDCEEILNNPEPLNNLLHHNNTFLTGYSGAESKATLFQSSDTDANRDEPQTQSVEVSLSYDNCEEDNDNTHVTHMYQSKKSFKCSICGQNFDDFSLLGTHSISGCTGNPIEENTIIQFNLDSNNLREESEHLSVDSSTTSNHNIHQDNMVCLLCGQVYTQKTLLEHQKVCVVRYEQERCATATTDTMSVSVDHTQMCGNQFPKKQCVVVLKRISTCRELSQSSTNKVPDNSPSNATIHNRLFPKLTDLYSMLIQPCNINALASVTRNSTGTDPVSLRREGECKLKCTLCEQTFSKLRLMKRHYFDVHGVKGSYQCPSCRRSFVRLCDMVKHHQNKRLLQCDMCKWCFTKLSELKSHKVLYKNNCATRLVCETCGKKCLTGAAFKLHQNQHRDKNESTVCTYCGKKLSSKYGLRVHMNRHTGGFRCPICPKVFYQKTCLKRHMNRHNGKEPYLCEICGKGWATPAYLKIHMVAHKDERPFKCDQCDMSYKREMNLKCHIVSKHTDQSPYVCDVCGAAYKHSSMLYEHKMKHDGSPRHICPKCGSGFARKYQLKMHREKSCQRGTELST